MNFPAHALWGKIVWKALTNGDPVLTSVWCGDQAHHRGGDQHVQHRAERRADQRGAATLRRGSLTRLAVIAAASTPMKENSATPAAIPMPL